MTNISHLTLCFDSQLLTLTVSFQLQRSNCNKDVGNTSEYLGNLLPGTTGENSEFVFWSPIAMYAQGQNWVAEQQHLHAVFTNLAAVKLFNFTFTFWYCSVPKPESVWKCREIHFSSLCPLDCCGQNEWVLPWEDGINVAALKCCLYSSQCYRTCHHELSKCSSFQLPVNSFTETPTSIARHVCMYSPFLIFHIVTAMFSLPGSPSLHCFVVPRDLTPWLCPSFSPRLSVVMFC